MRRILCTSILILAAATSFAQNQRTYMQILDTKGQTTLIDVSEISEITFVEYEVCGTITINGTSYKITKMVLDEQYRMYDDAYNYYFYSGNEKKFIAAFCSLYEQGSILENYFNYYDESLVTAGMYLLDKQYKGAKWSYQTGKCLEKSDFQEGTLSISLDRTTATLTVKAEGTTNDGTTFSFDLNGNVTIVSEE